MTDGGDAQRRSSNVHTNPISLPGTGSSSAELLTDSHDAGELRALLDRARERLAFYESFDRIIGENIKRSGELMLETIRLRDESEATARAAASVKADFEGRLRAERTRHHDLLSELLTDLDGLHAQLDTFREKLQSTIATIDGSDAAATRSDIGTEAGGLPTAPVAPPPVDADAAAPTQFRIIDALFHDVSDAVTALQLQRFVANIDGVRSVEAREFAAGILRLHVTAARSLERADFAAWAGDQTLQIRREQPTVIEATLEPASS